jgi:hypothetical protein
MTLTFSRKSLIITLAVVGMLVGFYIYQTKQPITPAAVNVYIPELKSRFDAVAVKYNLPYKWAPLAEPHPTSEGIEFTSMLISASPSSYPDIPLKHVVTGTQSNAFVTTTLGETDLKSSWSSALNGKEPLRIETSHSGDTVTGNYALPAAKFEGEYFNLNYTDITGEMQFGSSSSITTNPYSATIQVVIDLQTYQFTYDTTTSTSQFQSSGSSRGSGGINSALVQSNGVKLYEMKGIKSSWIQEIDSGNYLSASVSTNIDDVNVTGNDPINLNKLTFDIDLGNMPNNIIDQTTFDPDTPPDYETVIPAALKAFDRTLLIKFNSDWQGDVPGEVRSRMVVAALSDIDHTSPDFINNLMSKFLFQFKFQSKYADLKPSLRPMVDMLVEQGVLYKADDSAISYLSFKDGILEYNGQVIDEAVIQSMLSGPNPGQEGAHFDY